MSNVASPIHVKGEAGGGFRVGTTMIRIGWVGVFALFAFAAVAAMFGYSGP
jgi:hypothetical protein